MTIQPETPFAEANLLLKPWLAMVVWSVLLLGSLGWNLHQAQAARTELALRSARAFFEQVVLTRRWNARHGGVYVRVTAQTQPNPYLDIPKREIHVSEDLTLTVVNPAFMTRQLADIAQETSGVQFHITSLKPIRPENRPEPWERQALERFEQGAAEVSEFVTAGQHRSYRYMAPLITEQPCLDCHAEQGYKLGEVRGGISVKLPDVPALPWMSLLASHAIIGLVGGALILLSTRLVRESHNRLRQQAVLDTLTSIPNRRYFIERLVEEFRRGRRQSLPLSLVICDIDNFKSYNDTFGHPAGDRCLRTVAQTLKDGLKRGGDFCARYGGEEFVVVLPDTALSNAVQVAESMREAIAGLGMHHPGAPSGMVTISMGVATDDPSNPDHEALIQQADEALYRAKQLGRNRVETHHRSTTARTPLREVQASAATDRPGG